MIVAGEFQRNMAAFGIPVGLTCIRRDVAGLSVCALKDSKVSQLLYLKVFLCLVFHFYRVVEFYCV